YGHRGVIGPDDRTFQHEVLLELVEWPEQVGDFANPIAERAPGQIGPVPTQDILEPIQRQMVRKLGDGHPGEQAGSRNTSAQRWRRNLGGRHALTALRTGVLGQDVYLHLEVGRYELQHASLVFADACFDLATMRADLLGLGHIVLDADLW